MTTLNSLDVDTPLVNNLVNSLEIEPSLPLWKRVPTKDENGDYLSDFIMLIPRLNKQGKTYIGNTIDKLTEVLKYYDDVVVFADLNMRVNVLWISLKNRKGMCIEIPAAIKTVIPEAKLVGDNPDLM